MASVTGPARDIDIFGSVRWMMRRASARTAEPSPRGRMMNVTASMLAAGCVAGV